MQVPVHNLAGQVISMIELDDSVFGVPPKEALVHQALVRQLANARQGTADTKRRSEVAGGARKPYRQKGTGRARQGSIRSPQHRGGGVVFGPHPRSFRQGLPKKMRRLALRSALSARVAESRLLVVEELKLPAAKAKEMVQVLSNLGLDSSVLILTPQKDETVLRAAGNLPRVTVRPLCNINIVDLLSHDRVLLSSEAIRQVEAQLGEGREA